MRQRRVPAAAFVAWAVLGLLAWAAPGGATAGVKGRAAVPTASNFAYPQSIFVDPANGNLWVTDYDNNRVLRFDVSGLTSVTPRDGLAQPGHYALAQNYPNPFNPSSQISYEIARSGRVRLSVYDLLGREVAALVNGEQAAGSYTVRFSGEGLSSGVYLYRLQSGSFFESRKMILMK